MKIIINVPEKEFSTEIEDKFQDFFKRLEVETKEHMITGTSLLCGTYELETIEMFLNAFKQMKIITDNATKDNVTNGDVIKAMFPNIQWDNECNGIFYGYKTNNRTMAMLEADFNWWNAPYKRKGVKNASSN